MVALGKERGYIRNSPIPQRVEKEGFDLANLGNVRSQWVDVTPVIAARWLKNNFGNRPLREDTVKAYARDMINGVWVPTHQGIAFNDEDALIDGQHRLSAIVLSGCTVRMMVTFGLSSQIENSKMTTMDAVDRGATRSVADQLTIQHGFKQSGVKAAICAALGSLCFQERMRRLSVGQTLEVYHEFENAVEYVVEHRSKQNGLRTTGVLAGFAFALMTEENFWETKTRITGFLDQVNTGENLVEGSPIFLLRTFLTSEESKLFTRSLDRGLAELVLQAIHLELFGQTVPKLEMSLIGVNHFRELQRKRVDKVAGFFKLPSAKKETAAVTPSGPAPAKARPSIERILKCAEKFFGIDARILVAKGRDNEILFARGAALSAMDFHQHPPGSIGAPFRLEIKSVQYEIGAFKDLCATYPKKQARFEKFLASL